MEILFDWGDGTFTWTDWVDPGVTVNASHIWYEKGTYNVRVKAVDVHGYDSEWSDPLPVAMPISKTSHGFICKLLFRLIPPLIWSMLAKT